MGDDKPKTGSVEVIRGKKFAGERFSTIGSAEEIAANRELQKQYDHANAIPLSVYLVNKRITDPVQTKMMEAHTKVRKATTEAFDGIFKSYYGGE
jgi:hypothetical protein